MVSNIHSSDNVHLVANSIGNALRNTTLVGKKWTNMEVLLSESIRPCLSTLYVTYYKPTTVKHCLYIDFCVKLLTNRPITNLSYTLIALHTPGYGIS